MSWNAPKDTAERYYAIVDKILTDEGAFSKFKSLDDYNSIVGMSLPYQAPLFMERIKKCPSILEKMDDFKKNDIYGNPTIIDIEGHKISPNTLRHMATIADIEKYIGNIDNMSVSELGVGYGGLAYVLNTYYKPSSYHLIDLPQVQQLASKYLDKLEVKVSIDTPPESVDLFISEFCLSEFYDEQLYKFYNQYVKNAKNVYLMMNLIDETRKQKFIDTMNEDFNLRIIPETHGTNYPCYIIIGKKETVDDYTKFDNLVEDINNVSNIKVRVVNHAGGNHIGIGLQSKPFPLSINESEYNFMHKVIVDNNLKNGFELSTGTGISTLSLGKAFAKTNGRMITLDSYYEDINQISSNIPVMNYTPETIADIKSKSPCYNLVKELLTHYNLLGQVEQHIGWSPTDSVKLLKSRPLLDFVFLDCPKSDEEFERDITSLRPFIGEKYVIFVHDAFIYSKKSGDIVKSLFGVEFQFINEYFKDTVYYSKRHYPIGLITNIL